MEIDISNGIPLVGLFVMAGVIYNLWKSTRANATETATFRTSVEKDIESLRAGLGYHDDWQKRHKAECTSEHQQIRDDFKEGIGRLENMMREQGADAKADRKAFGDKFEAKLDALVREVHERKG